MLSIPPPRYRKRRGEGRPAQKSPTPPPAGLTLVSANYDADVLVVLEFDRPITIDALDGSQITFNDPNESSAYAATGPANLVSPNTVEIGIVATGPGTGSQVTLTATGNTGIVAVDDGGTWGGVSGVVVPFP